MPTLQIQFFGDFQLYIEENVSEENVAPVPLNLRQQTLLAHLRLRRGTPVSCRVLGQWLWPDLPVADSVAMLHGTLDELFYTAPFLRNFFVRNSERMCWDMDISHRCDVTDFEEALTRAYEARSAGDDAAAEEELMQAAASYKGTLLPALDDVWIDAERERLHLLYTTSLTRLVPLLEQKQDISRAVAYARTLSEHNLLYEPLHRRLTHLYVCKGGRAPLLQTLEQRLDAAAQGQGSFVFIRGEAGMGKTSLAMACEAQARRRGALFVAGHCYEHGVAAPFAPWQELVEALAATGHLDRSQLPEPFGQAPPTKSAYQLVQTVASQVRALATAHPLVILLDDMHWVEQDALDLLEYMTRHVQSTRLLLLVTWRSEDVYRHSRFFRYLPTLQHNRPAEHMTLDALTLADTARLVEAYQGPCSPQLADYLYTRAEGHPLFLVQLLRDLIERDLLRFDPLEGWLPPAHTVSVPVLLRQVISERIARLGPQAEMFLEAAAVIGETWHLAVVERLLGWPEETLLRVLDAILTSGTVITTHSKPEDVQPVQTEQTESYRFGHGLIREVLYNRQLPRRRKQLHSQVSGLLVAGQPEDTESLAYHSFRAEQWLQAFRYSLQAGDVAQKRYAMHGALQFYQQALSALQELGNRGLGESAQNDELLNVYERLGRTYMALNYKEEAVSVFTQAIETARSAGNPRAQAHALIQLSVNQDRLYLSQEATETSTKALRVAEQANDATVLTLSHFQIGRRMILAGDLAQATHHLDLAEQVAHTAAESAGLLAQVLRMKIYLAIWYGEYMQGEAMTHQALDLARQAHDAAALAALPFQLGYILTARGQYEKAQQVLQQGVRDVEQLGERHQYLPKLLNMLGHLFYELGDIPAALEWNRRALAASRHDGVYYNGEAACYAFIDLAAAHLKQGNLAEAERMAREFETIIEWVDYARYRPLNRYQLFQAEIALARGDHEAVLEHTSIAAELVREKNFAKNRIKIALYEGQAWMRLGDLHRAADQLQQAVDLADRVAHASLRWQTRLRFAEACVMLGRSPTELYRQALAIVDELVSNLRDPHLRSSFLGSPLVMELRANARLVRKELAPDADVPDASAPDVDVSAPDGRAGIDAAYPAGLTAREVQVLRLVTGGATNRQIAAELHLSVSTVNTHLGNILNKTGCENRTAAAAFALQHNLLAREP